MLDYVSGFLLRLWLLEFGKLVQNLLIDGWGGAWSALNTLFDYGLMEGIFV